MKLNDDELEAMHGLPWIARMVYIFGIRPHMDYKTGLVGVARKISLKSISESLYVEPSPGLKETGSPTEKQIRRAIEWLEKNGLIKRDKSKNKNTRSLVFSCDLAFLDKSVQNKVGRQVGSKWAEPEPPKNHESDTIHKMQVGRQEGIHQLHYTTLHYPPKSPQEFSIGDAMGFLIENGLPAKFVTNVRDRSAINRCIEKGATEQDFAEALAKSYDVSDTPGPMLVCKIIDGILFKKRNPRSGLKGANSGESNGKDYGRNTKNNQQDEFEKCYADIEIIK